MTGAFRRAALPAVLTAAVAAVVAAAGAPAGASARPTGPHWAPAASATIHPGVQVTIAQTTCTAGYVLTDGRDVYLTVPASCSGVSAGMPNDGCQAANMPLGLPVTVQGARYRGTFVYSSWIQMQSTGTGGADGCAANDLTLVRLDRRDVARTNPSVPILGGPTGVSRTAPAPGSQLTAYITAATQAVAISNSDGGWSHEIAAAAPMTVANTGSPVLTPSGSAVGMVGVIPQTGGGPATVGDLGKELAWLHRVATFRGVRLALGTKPFVGARSAGA